MKISILVTLMILSSCGQYTADTLVGERKSTNAVTIDQAQQQQIKAICDAIADKTASAPALVGTQVIFGLTTKACGAASAGPEVSSTTTIQNNGDGFKFKLPTNVNFYFADIETTDKGSLAPICDQLATEGALFSPINTGNEYLYFSTVGINSDDCPTLADQTCIYLQKASKDGEGFSKIHTKEWIRINREANLGRLGFFTLKKEFTTLGCIEDAHQVHLAILK